MKLQKQRACRPFAEVMEERCVPTAHTLSAFAEIRSLASRVQPVQVAVAEAGTFRAPTPGEEAIQARAAVHTQLLNLRAEISALRAHHRRRFPRPNPGPVQPPLGGQGLIRLGLPAEFVDYGVVSLWNNTNTTVTFAVSASTYRQGQAFNFTLLPGQNRSFYAPVVNGFKPLFQVNFNPRLSTWIPLPEQNIVFESPSYFPAGTAGYPYAIGIGVNGYFLTTI